MLTVYPGAVNGDWGKRAQQLARPLLDNSMQRQLNPPYGQGDRYAYVDGAVDLGDVYDRAGRLPR